ncbi:MAG TPA: hypothetical protein VFS96_02685 [Nitrolancea sp.]|nr:hypothetical protein [Nitrolancea sp.]
MQRGAQLVSDRVKWAGITLIAATGLIHLIEAPEYFEFATYLGVAFLLNVVGALVAAVGIYRNRIGWGWLLGLLVAAGAFVMYVVSRTIGLPGLTETEWGEPIGILSLVVEGLFSVLAFYHLTRSGRSHDYVPVSTRNPESFDRKTHSGSMDNSRKYSLL